jgi:putative endonuclease
MKQYFVYILANQNNHVLYLGRTENLSKRIHEHRNGIGGVFSSKYKTYKLVYVEAHETSESAAQSEWKMKKWRREWKNNIISQQNPEWKDQYEKFCTP